MKQGALDVPAYWEHTLTVRFNKEMTAGEADDVTQAMYETLNAMARALARGMQGLGSPGYILSDTDPIKIESFEGGRGQ